MTSALNEKLPATVIAETALANVDKKIKKKRKRSRKKKVTKSAETEPPSTDNSATSVTASTAVETVVVPPTVANHEVSENSVPKKKKRKRTKKKKSAAALAIAAEKAAVDAAKVQLAASAKKKSKKSAISQEAFALLPADEQARRNKQRATMELVLKLRAEGKSKIEIRRAKRRLQYNDADTKRFRKKRASRKDARDIEREEKKARKQERKENGPILTEGMKMGQKHDLVIVPVFWKAVEGQKEGVLAAAAELKKQLIKGKVNTWIDFRTRLTPGQKFAYWEHLGVKLRIELGPREVEKGTCTLAIIKKAGDVQDKIKDLPMRWHEDEDGKPGLESILKKRGHTFPSEKHRAWTDEEREAAQKLQDEQRATIGIGESDGGVGTWKGTGGRGLGAGRSMGRGGRSGLSARGRGRGGRGRGRGRGGRGRY